MGPASSSAARISEAPSFGSLASMGARTFKKKPVLVLDPDELAQAHLLFQQDAAEQIDGFDPDERARNAASLFGLAPLSDDDGTDETIADLDAEPDDETGLPEPEKVLALTRPAKRATEQAMPFGAAPDTPVQPELPAVERTADDARQPTPAFAKRAAPVVAPAAEPEPVQEIAPQPDPAPALPRAPAEPVTAVAQPGRETPVDNAQTAADPTVSADDGADDWGEDETDGAWHTAADPGQAAHTAVPAPFGQALEQAFGEPLGGPGAEPVDEPLDLTFAEEIADEPVARILPADHVIAPEPDDPRETITLFRDEDDDWAAEEPAPAFAPPTGAHSSLRARLVRDDVSLARPDATLWRKIAAGIRRIWQFLTFR